MNQKKYKKCFSCKQKKVNTVFYIGENICRSCSDERRAGKTIPKKYLVRGAIHYPNSSNILRVN